jgi:hypothetical protein
LLSASAIADRRAWAWNEEDQIVIRTTALLAGLVPLPLLLGAAPISVRRDRWFEIFTVESVSANSQGLSGRQIAPMGTRNSYCTSPEQSRAFDAHCPSLKRKH